MSLEFNESEIELLRTLYHFKITRLPSDTPCQFINTAIQSLPSTWCNMTVIERLAYFDQSVNNLENTEYSFEEVKELYQSWAIAIGTSLNEEFNGRWIIENDIVVIIVSGGTIIDPLEEAARTIQSDSRKYNLVKLYQQLKSKENCHKHN